MQAQQSSKTSLPHTAPSSTRTDSIPDTALLIAPAPLPLSSSYPQHFLPGTTQQQQAIPGHVS
eukprot:764504-Hanusia_phi.AAC.1